LVSLVNFMGSIPLNVVSQVPQREDLFTPEGHLLRPADEQAFEALEPTSPTVAANRGTNGIPRPHTVAQVLQGVENGELALDFLGKLLHADPEVRLSVADALTHPFLKLAPKLPPPVPPSAEEVAKKPRFIQDEGTDESTGEEGTKLTRKGTGFVHVGELPPSDDEDEDEDEEDKHVQIKDTGGEGEGGGLTRKGTGFVHVGELPPSDDEDEDEEEKKVQIAEQESGHEESKLARKGTGYVFVGELPPSDSEDEDEEDKHVKIQGGGGDEGEIKEGGLTRKGTGFVHVGELPPSDDEDEEEEEEDEKPKHVSMSSEAQHKDLKAQQAPAKGPIRKGTGFVHLGELPASDDEDDEDEDENEGPAKKVNIKAQDEDGAATAQDISGKMGRKGTGFVNLNDLPDDSEEDEEDEDDDAKHVGFDASAGAGTAKLAAGGGAPVRKGTGFVMAADIPDSDEDEDEESEEEKAPLAVSFKENSGAKQGKPIDDTGGKVQRKGTGFVHLSDIVASSDDEDEDED